MNTTVKNIILGKQSIGALDDIFGIDYNEQNDRYKKILKIFITKMRNQLGNSNIQITEIDLYIEKLINDIKDVNSLLNQYILGAKMGDESLDDAVSKILGIIKTINLDDVEDMFAEDNQDELNVSEFQIEEYKRFPELFEKDVNYGILTSKQAELIKNKIYQEEQSESKGKAYTLAKKGYNMLNQDIDLKKEINLGFVEPVLLSLVVSLVGLIYVGYLYLVV